MRLRQVLWNLVDNALKHTPEGGRVTLGSTGEPAGRVGLFVRDTGEGIAPGMADLIFQPFEQGRPRREGDGGLGLGLAICRGIVEAHGGEISAATPRDGKGALFTVTLPTVAPPAVEPAERPAATPRKRTARRVLLVEDNPDNAAAMSEYLRLRGYDVHVADSVASALRAAVAGFDVLVSDIGLPDGTGQDLVRQLTGNGPVPAVALSGYGARSDIEKSRAAGFGCHLTKPVDPDELVAAIEQIAGGDRSRLAGSG